MNETFSTREMGRFCGVNESTIKRWADSGRLPCLKTPGGHRRFRIRDALAFLNEYGFEGLGLEGKTTLPETLDSHSAQLLRGNWDDRAARYLELSLTGPSPAVARFLFQLVTAGCTLVEICDRVVTPALASLGERWLTGSVSILDEHMVSASTIHGLERLRQTLPHLESNGLVALCSPMEGEHHEIGTRMAALLLDQLGWDVRLAVDGTPVPELVRFIRQERPGLVCLSVSSLPMDEARMEQLQIVWQATRETDTRLALGGSSTHGHDRIPCDLNGQCLAKLETFAVGLVGHRGTRGAPA